MSGSRAPHQRSSSSSSSSRQAASTLHSVVPQSQTRRSNCYSTEPSTSTSRPPPTSWVSLWRGGRRTFLADYSGVWSIAKLATMLQSPLPCWAARKREEQPEKKDCKVILSTSGIGLAGFSSSVSKVNFENPVEKETKQTPHFWATRFRGGGRPSSVPQSATGSSGGAGERDSRVPVHHDHGHRSDGGSGQGSTIRKQQASRNANKFRPHSFQSIQLPRFPWSTRWAISGAGSGKARRASMDLLASRWPIECTAETQS
jgi:hypothetical protein